MNARDRHLQALRAQITQITPQQAHTEQHQQHALIIDIREADEIAQGMATDAIAISRGFLELEIDTYATTADQPIHIMCGSGVRSLFAADALTRMGYRHVSSIAGGFKRWKDEGLPFHIPQTLQADARQRYARQILLPEVGVAGQQALLDARVLLVGAGGLGAPAALYLAAAGVGTIGIVDDDMVERSNLNRQVIHTEQAIGTPKIESARAAMLALNPTINVQTHALRLTPENVEQVFGDYDVIVDGTDNFAAHYLCNDACVKLQLPCVHGSIYRYDAQISVFWPASDHGGPCYRCLYPSPPPPELAPSCNEAGVLGVVPGTVGMLQATEALKLIMGIGKPLIGRLLCFDALAMQFRELAIARDPDCAYCGDKHPFPGYMNYEQFCHVQA